MKLKGRFELSFAPIVATECIKSAHACRDAQFKCAIWPVRGFFALNLRCWVEIEREKKRNREIETERWRVSWGKEKGDDLE